MKSIPVLTVQGKTIPEVWENSLTALLAYGTEFETQYDKEGDPKSLDCTMNLTIEEPMTEPMIHRSFPGGPTDLQEYMMEVCDGIKDHWIRDPNNPDDKRWEYTYHQRLFEYMLVDGMDLIRVNQFEKVCQKLADSPFTRQAQMVTWQPWVDLDCYDPACLQSFWFRIIDQEDGSGVLCTNVRIRSNDAYKAAFMNIFAFIMMAQKVADRVSELSGRPIIVGRYNHQADSYHVYGKDIKEFKERFITSIHTRTFEERTFEYVGMMKDMMIEAIPEIEAKIARQDNKS